MMVLIERNYTTHDYTNRSKMRKSVVSTKLIELFALIKFPKSEDRETAS